MNPTQQPYESRFGSEWGEEERIQLALQIFRQRQRTTGNPYLPSQVLFDHLSGFLPDWEDLPLPTGRTVSQGKIVYSNYTRSGPSTSRSSGPSPGSYGFSNTGGVTGTVPSRKRSAPSEFTALTPTAGRPLMPKQPSTFPTEPGGRSITGHQPISPLVEPPPTLGEPRKKRGRPTKQEAEERRRLMEERNQARMAAQSAGSYGSPFPSHQPQQTYQPSLPPSVPPPAPRADTPGMSAPVPTPVAVMQTPQAQNPATETEQNSSGSSGKRRKTRPARLSVSEPDPPPQLPLGPSLSQHGTSAYGSPPHSGSHRGRRASMSARLSGPSPGPPLPLDQEDAPRFNVSEENRAQNQRSRAWEDTVMGRHGS